MLVSSSTVREATELLAELVWLAILAAAIAGTAAAVYRWYVRESIPAGLSLLLGLAGVTVYLNTSRALGQVMGGSTLPTEREVALFNVAAFALATGSAVLGRRVGERVGSNVALRSSVDGVERDIGRLVETVGRVVAVELPRDIDDVVGYDPVPEETKETLAGRTFLFPQRLTVADLHDRLVSRLKSDYAVGHVDLELAADGTVEHLALASRAAGIGPTLPPETNALAIRADPAFAASAGDLVQVWETDPARRLLTAELRGVAGDTVTVAIDAADTTKVDPRTEYRLVTLPVEDRPDREFVSLLRAADETCSSVTVEAGSPLEGLPAGALEPTVVAANRDDGTPVVLPEPGHRLAPGEAVFAIGPPEALRRLETAAEPLDPAVVSSDDRPRRPDDSAHVTGQADGSLDLSDIEGDDLELGDPEADADDELAGGDPDDGTENGDDEDSDGGGKSFQELKEEFESGEADWNDDVSDSPGGDMRLDE